MKKLTKNVLFSTAILTGLVFAGSNQTSAEEVEVKTEPSNASQPMWVARTVDEVRKDIQAIDKNTDKYTIVRGDTTSVIAEAAGITLDDLIAWNNIANRDLIFTGNTLIFRADGTVSDTRGNTFTLSEESKAGRAEVKAQAEAQAQETTNQAVNQEISQNTANGGQTQVVDQKPSQDTGIEQNATPSKPDTGATVTPEKPVVPELPVNPVVPEVPGTGGETEKPEQPGTGGETEKPEEPGTGGETEKPEEPGTGGETEKPEEPGTGGETEKPEEPGTGGETEKPENPVWVPEQVIPEQGHWEDGVKEVWVPNIVTIVDKPAYTETITYTLCTFAYDGKQFKITAHISTPEGQAQAEAVEEYSMMLMEQGHPANYSTRDVTEEVTHPAVTHTEDHGSYQTVPDPDNQVWVVDVPEQVIPGHWA